MARAVATQLIFEGVAEEARVSDRFGVSWQLDLP